MPKVAKQETKKTVNNTEAFQRICSELLEILYDLDIAGTIQEQSVLRTKFLARIAMLKMLFDEEPEQETPDGIP